MAVLDTSFLIDLQRRRPEARRALDRLVAAGEALIVPAQVAAEFAAGDGDETTALHKIAASYELVHTTDAHLVEVAKLARRALLGGRFPGWPDAHVAAAATLEATFVVTADARAFEALDVPAWDYRRGGEPPGGLTRS